MLHYEFITTTDNKSLFNQIKFLVNCGKESFQRDLTKRREHLKDLLDGEEKIYEDEFVGKIKSRVDENIRERQDSLLAMKQERHKEIRKFVAAKKLHQNMTNCIQIRDELRRKDYQETQLCQLEQMDDKLRALAQEKEEEEFWMKVQNNLAEDYDRMQEREEALKRGLQVNQCNILRKQLKEHEVRKANEWANVLKSAKELGETIKAKDKQEKDKALEKFKYRYKDIRESRAKICEQKMQLAQEAENFEEVFHTETMRQVRKEMEDELNKNAGIKEAVRDYLDYVKRFKNFLSEEDSKCDKLYDEMKTRFYCFKAIPKRSVARKKREFAEECHRTLLKQICEQHAKRAEQEAYDKEHKILENRFAPLRVKDKLKEREMIRKGLDSQIEVLARINEEKQKHFEKVLDRAEEDEQFCEQLLERHKSDGCDYLTPHPNWKLLACYKPDCKPSRASGGT